MKDCSRMKFISISTLLILVTAQQSVGGSVAAAPGSSVSNLSSSGQTASAADLKAIATLESAYFQRLYEEDTPEKRMKRLELFINGEGQWGSVSQRIAALRTAIASKSHLPKTNLSPTKRNASQSLSTLEKSILKHTCPNLDLSSRLTTLEKKVFGTAFPNLAVDQRISRLQKTIGIGEDDIASMPFRTYPDSQLQMTPQMIPPGSIFNSPFMSPFGSSNDMTSDPAINRHMGEMFDHLNRQLQQLHQVPPGTYFYQPPNQMPRQFAMPKGTQEFSDGLPSAPGDLQTKPALPPYMDPNSI